jgi:hypothetical protein
MNKILTSKVAEWLYRLFVMALLAAVAFLRDTATKDDLVPIKVDLAELKRAVIELDKKVAVNEALRQEQRRAGD